MSGGSLRITLALTYYAPHWTGLTMYARTIAERLAERGHSVRVVTTRHEPSLPAVEWIGGVEVRRAAARGRASRGVIAPGFVPAVARALRYSDVLHLHTPLPEAGPLALAARARGVPVVVTHQGDLVMPAGLRNRAIEASVVASMRVALRLARTVTTFTADYADASRFLAPHRHKLTPILPLVAIPAPDRGAAQRWRRELGLSGRPLVGFAGRFVEEKGFDVLLRALPELVARRPDVALAYAGAAPDYEPFMARCRPLLDAARERLSLLGLIADRRRLADFYAMCDVLAVPSRSDCFPAVQVEALSCGTPVVVADIPGARVPVRLTAMGTTFRAGDPQALAAALARVLDDPARYARPAHEVAAVLDAERALDRYERVLRAGAPC